MSCQFQCAIHSSSPSLSVSLSCPHAATILTNLDSPSPHTDALHADGYRARPPCRRRRDRHADTPADLAALEKVKGDDCTHFCSPGANEVWVYLLYKLLEEDAAEQEAQLQHGR